MFILSPFHGECIEFVYYKSVLLLCIYDQGFRMPSYRSMSFIRCLDSCSIPSRLLEATQPLHSVTSRATQKPGDSCLTSRPYTSSSLLYCVLLYCIVFRDLTAPLAVQTNQRRSQFESPREQRQLFAE